MSEEKKYENILNSIHKLSLEIEKESSTQKGASKSNSGVLQWISRYIGFLSESYRAYLYSIGYHCIFIPEDQTWEVVKV